MATNYCTATGEGCDSMRLGSIILRVKLSSNGRPYILLSQPLESRKENKCCWFQDDWDGIKAIIPQVQALLGASAQYDRKVRTTIRSNREVVFTIGRSKLTVRVDCSKEPGLVSSFSTTFDLTSWAELVARQDEIDELIAEHDPQLKRKREQSAVGNASKKLRPSELRYYGWTILSSPSILTGTRNILKESSLSGTIYWTREECEVEARRNRIAVDGDDPMLGGGSDCLIHELSCKIPDDMELIYDIFLFAVHCKIVSLQDANCSACDTQQPGQAAHMQGGCLMPWGETVEKWGTKAFEQVTISLLVDLHAAFMKRVGGEPSHYARLIAQCVKAYVTDYEETLQDDYDVGGPTSTGESPVPVFKDCFKELLDC